MLLFLLHFHAIAPAAIVNNMVRITAIAILPDAEQEPIVSAVTKEKLYAYFALALGMMEKTKMAELDTLAHKFSFTLLALLYLS